MKKIIQNKIKITNISKGLSYLVVTTVLSFLTTWFRKVLDNGTVFDYSVMQNRTLWSSLILEVLKSVVL